MAAFRLHDWNDVRLIIAVAERGSFAAAAAALGLDQTTVSRRISNMEKAIDRPLFTRRRSGAEPTIAGLALLERARQMAAMADEFEGALSGLGGLPSPRVTVAASEGLLTYTLIPTLMGHKKPELPLDWRQIKAPLPELAFTTASTKADISVIATSPGDLPPVAGAVHVRRVGTMNFAPIAARDYLAEAPSISCFEDLAAHPLIDIAIYRAIRGLGAWNGIVAERGAEGVMTVSTTPQLHVPLSGGKGVAILPDYSTIYHDSLVQIDLPRPDMAVSLWLVSHEDALREPSVRGLYDLLAGMFLSSPCYREK